MKIKKFSQLIYFLVIAMLIFSLSGCGGSSHSKKSNDSDSNGGNNTTASKLMVVSSAAFVSGDSYRIYKGDKVSVMEDAVKNKKLYVKPAAAGSETITMNLQFSGTASNDEPFVITESDGQTVIVAYNPSGSGTDGTTASVTRYGGGTQQQKYEGLTISSTTGSEFMPSVIDIETDDAIDIVLNSDGTATVGGTKITAQESVWHLSPDYAGEYWTIGTDTTKYLKKSKVEKELTITDGVYIAHDIRYVPDTFTFKESQTATKANGTAEGDSDKLYVAYYNTDAEGLPDGNTYNYIAAALPSGMGDAPAGTGGTPGGEMPSGEMPGGTTGGTPPTPPSGSSFRSSATSFSDIVKQMVHSASDAYKNPVLHITEPGTYRLSGTWYGQIWVDTDDDVSTDQVALILDGVTVNCTVAPALVFKKVYECYDSDTYTATNVASDYMKMNDKLFDSEGIYAGAIVVIANGSENSFTGTNVARLNEGTLNTDDGYTSSDIGKYVKAQEKLYKLDGAFHSRRSMVIGLEYGATSGTLTVNSDYEGLDSEMHMLINSGTIEVNADDDGINVNEDDMSVFYMEGGTVTIKSTGGDGIDSNGYIVVSGGKLYVSAGNAAIGSAGESGMDADKHIEITDDAAYYWAKAGSTSWALQNSYSGTSENAVPGTPTNNNNQTTTQTESESVTDANGNTTTLTFQATTSNTQLGTKTVESRTAAGVATSGTSFKVLSGYNDFAGITNN